MGWGRRDEEGDLDWTGGEACSTKKVVSSQCKTEEVEPGKFLRRCHKTEELLRNCIGKPTEVLQSNQEYTEEDVTDLVKRGSLNNGSFNDGTGPFDFPGLRSDIEGIERHFLGGINRFFEAAEEMKHNFFSVFGDFSDENSSPSKPTRRGIPINDGNPRIEAHRKKSKKDDSGEIDLSGLATEV